MPCGFANCQYPSTDCSYEKFGFEYTGDIIITQLMEKNCVQIKLRNLERNAGNNPDTAIH